MDDKFVKISRDIAFEAIHERIREKNGLEKKANPLGTTVGMLSDFTQSALFNFLPAAFFGIPFVAGGLKHVIDRSLVDQETKHKKRMKQLYKSDLGDL